MHSFLKLRLVGVLYFIGTGCVFISDEELAYRQGGAQGCSDAWYLDADRDGVGGDVVLLACESPGVEYTELSGDCDDTDPNISPLAQEDCTTTVDEDCDGTQNSLDPTVLEPKSCLLFYTDFDQDGFGSNEDMVCACQADEIYSLLVSGDCNDQLSSVNPDQNEICGDGWDNNCDDSANGCGYTNDDVLSEDVSIVGSMSQAYSGSQVGLAPLLPDANTSVLVYNSRPNGLNHIDLFDADTLWSDQEVVSVMDSVASVTGSTLFNFGAMFATGDVTGDQVVDLIVSASDLSVDDQDSIGGWYLFEGPIRGVRSTGSALVSAVGANAEDEMGTALSIVGTDVWAGAPGSDQGALDAGVVEMWSSEGVLNGQIFGNEPSMRFGSSISRSADVNGDGLADVAVGAPGANSNKGAVGIFWNASEMTAQNALDADAFWNGVIVDGQVGSQVQMVGDVTGDGYGDVLMAAPNVSMLYIVDGGIEGPNVVDNAMATIQGDVGSALGTAVAHVGDINGDQISDIVTGDYLTSSIHIVYGPIQGVISAEDIVRLENRGTDQFGASLAGGYDFTDDGVLDFVVGAPIASEGFSQNGVVLMLEGLGL